MRQNVPVAPEADMSPAAQAVLKQVRSSANLPAVPAVVLKVLSLSRDPDVDFGALVTHVSADPAIAAKLLEMANSSFFGARMKITSVHGAVVRLGLKVTRTAALAFALAAKINPKAPASLDVDAFWRWALTTASAARCLARRVCPRRQDDAFAAGLLQDVATLALQCTLPEQYAPVRAALEADPPTPLHALEQQHLGVDHAQIGTQLLQEWGVPREVCVPVRYHHVPQETPESCPDDLRTLAGLLHFGDAVAHLFFDEQKAPPQKRLAALATDMFDLDEENLNCLLADVQNAVQETSSLFGLGTGDLQSYDDIRALAAEEIARFALESDQCRERTERAWEDTSQDVRALRHDVERLQELASVDDLTTLLNRRGFMERLEEEVDRARRENSPVCLIAIDIDHFKAVNDKFGHAAGDNILNALGRFLRGAVRKSDVIGRIGGEEFLVLLPHARLPHAARVADKLRQAIADVSPGWHDDLNGITVSAGAIEAATDSLYLNTEVFLREADNQMYMAKAAGRNCIRAAAL